MTELEKKQETNYDELLKAIEKYTDKKLKELLYEFRLSVSGVKAVKKKRIQDYLEKAKSCSTNITISTNVAECRTCDTCGEKKKLDNKKL